MTELKVQRKHAAGTSDLTSNCQNDFPTKHCLGTMTELKVQQKRAAGTSDLTSTPRGNVINILCTGS